MEEKEIINKIIKLKEEQKLNFNYEIRKDIQKEIDNLIKEK